MLHAVIAVLSGGPVGIGDRSDNINQTIINMTCRSDGLILRPESPSTMNENDFMLEMSNQRRFVSKQSITYLKGDRLIYEYGLVVNMSHSVNLNDAIWDIRAKAFKPESLKMTADFQTDKEWIYYLRVPTISAWNFIGETNKIAPISNIRNFHIIQVNNNKMLITLNGVPQEMVELTAIYLETTVLAQTIKIDRFGNGKITFRNQKTVFKTSS